MSQPAQHNQPPHEGISSGRIYATCVTLVVALSVTTGVMWYTRHTAIAAERDAREAVVAAGPRVLVAPAAPLPAERTLTLPGDVHAWQQATLYAKLSGYLRDIRVDKGEHVKANQVIGVVEAPETDQQIRASEADLAVKKQIEARYRSLVGSGVISQQDMDHADADLRGATAQLARLEALRAYEEIRAPFAGIITTRYVDPGALLPAATGSTSSAQPLVEIQDINQIRIFTYVAQSEAPFVQVGSKAHITSEVDSTLNIDATVTRISHALDPRTRTMLVEIVVDNADGRIYPGLYVRVGLTVTTPPGLAVPSDAIILRGGKSFVAVIKDNHAVFTAVRTGDDDGYTVRILDGLKAGDLVGLHVGDEVTDGAAVQPVMQKK